MLVGILFSGNSTLYKHRNTDFPGGPVVKNLPANVKGHRFYPWPGRTPHAMEQLSPFAATTEAKAPRVPGKQGNPLQWEASALHLESSPYKLQLEKAWVYQWRPSTAPNKQINKNQDKKKKTTKKNRPAATAKGEGSWGCWHRSGAHCCPCQQQVGSIWGHSPRGGQSCGWSWGLACELLSLTWPGATQTLGGGASGGLSCHLPSSPHPQAQTTGLGSPQAWNLLLSGPILLARLWVFLGLWLPSHSGWGGRMAIISDSGAFSAQIVVIGRKPLPADC